MKRLSEQDVRVLFGKHSGTTEKQMRPGMVDLVIKAAVISSAVFASTAKCFRLK